jgi:hypothetical protein
MGKIFLAFADYSSHNKSAIKKIGNLEFFNLTKIGEEDFFRLMKKRFNFPNKKVVSNFKKSNDYKFFQKIYGQSAWGMMVPYDSKKDDIASIYTPTLIVHLYTAKPLITTFIVADYGPWLLTRELRIHQRGQFHSEDKSLLSKKFIKFYKEILPAVHGTDWEACRVTKWDKEDWRMHLAIIFFKQLADYYNKKPVTTWPKECADIVTLIETLFSVDESDYGKRAMMQRIEIVLRKFYGKKFLETRKDLNELFNYRNKFTHGRYFLKLKKSTTAYPDNDKMAQLPSVDMRLLSDLEIITRDIILVYLYLLKTFNRLLNKRGITLSGLIQETVMDIKLRKRIDIFSEKILRLVERGK